jgi:Rho GTPase-activating protein 1
MPVVEFIRKDIVTQVSQNNLMLMKEVFRLLKMVADRHESNKMTAYNLAVVMSPNMVRHEDVMQEIAMSAVSTKEKDSAMEEPLTLGTVVRIMIECYDEIF